MKTIKLLLIGLCVIFTTNTFAFCIYNELDFEVRWQWQDAPFGTKDGAKLGPHGEENDSICREDNKRDPTHARILIFIPHGARDIFRFGRDLEYLCPGLVINPKAADIHIKTDGLQYFCTVTAHQ